MVGHPDELCEVGEVGTRDHLTQHRVSIRLRPG